MVTWVSNFLNSGEDLSASCGVKGFVNLNPSLIFGTAGGATVLTVVLAPVVEILGGSDVTVTSGVLVLARNEKENSIVKANYVTHYSDRYSMGWSQLM